MINKLIAATLVALLALGCAAQATVGAKSSKDLNAQREAQLAEQRKIHQQELSIVKSRVQQDPDQPQQPAAPNNQLATPAPHVLPPVVAMMPKINGVGIIGFAYGAGNPCIDNAYERALNTGAQNQLAGFQQLLPRRLIGRCAAIRRSTYWTNVLVDNVQMQARYIQDARGPVTVAIPMSYCSTKDGKTRYMPLTPPGSTPGNPTPLPQGTTYWLMPTGQHTISIELYEPSAEGTCYEYVRTVTYTIMFPFQQDPWGTVINQPEKILH